MAGSIKLKSRASGSSVKTDASELRTQSVTSIACFLPPNPDPVTSKSGCRVIEKKLLWLLDRWLIPWLCMLYLLAFLDRTNIGNARIAGLQKALGAHGRALSTRLYNLALTVFFISYSLIEPLTNILLKRYKPSIFIPCIMLGWGTTMTLMGFCKNASGLIAARWFLGIFEAGLFPGVNYYLSCWYKRSEFGIRAAIFFSAAAFSGSFGGLLAYWIERMEGVGGRPGWSWIFILEGLVTVCFALASFFMVKDFPENATFLSDRNLARVKYRLAMDKQASAKYEAFDYRYLKAAVTDHKMYLGMLIYMGCDMPLYAFSLFLPSIISELGYTSAKAQLFTVPVYGAAAVLTIFIGGLADRTGQRGLCNICIAPIGIAGFTILLFVENPHLKYFGTFLGACGIYPCIANTISWVSNNVEGVYKRGVILGFVIGWGNFNGIVSSNIYQGGPNYFSGHLVVLIYMTCCLFGGSLIMRFLLARENRLRREGKRDYRIQGLNQREQDLLGDQHPEFMYIL